MSNEIDVSDSASLQGGGGTGPERVLRLILAQVAADSSSAVTFQLTDKGTAIRYEVAGCRYEMGPPPAETMGPLLRILKQKAGLSVDAGWGEGELLLHTKKGPMTSRLVSYVDPQDRSFVLLSKVPECPTRDRPTTADAKGSVDMYERFSDRARKVMALANQEAQRFNHEYIGTEHILLGLVKEGSGGGATVLKKLDVDVGKVRLEVQRLVQSGPDVVSRGKLPQTPRAKKVIEYAIEEARSLHHSHVSTEHMLLGLVREEEGIAAQVLMNLGLELDELRQAVCNLVGAPSDAESPRVLGLPSFTTSAKQAMALAHREAAGRNSPYIETAHIILGLIKVGGGAAPRILDNLNVDAKALREEIETVLLAGGDGACEEEPVKTSRARDALRFAIQEAVALQRPHVGTEHLLLGAMCESDARTSQILMDFGLSVDAVRQELVNGRGEIGEGEAESILRQSFPADLLRCIGVPADAAALKADELASRVYQVAGTFPKGEARDIASQMRRCALSIPPHLAEARRRAGQTESRWFLNIAISALIELQHLLDFSLNLGYIEEQQYSALRELSDGVEAQLRDWHKP